MNKHELIAKTISKKTGYKYKHYSTNYEDGIIHVRHYGTCIISFSIEHKLDNGYFAEIGNGYSVSDRSMLGVVLNQLWREAHAYYGIQRENSVKPDSKWFKERYQIISKGRSFLLTIDRPPKQSTLYGFEPYSTYVQTIHAQIREETEIAKKQITKYLNEQLAYLQSFTSLQVTDKGLEFDLNGEHMLITFDGTVYSIQKGQADYRCVHIRDNDKSLTPVDVALTKALGIQLRPQMLNEGIRSNRGNPEMKTLAEVLMDSSEFSESINKKRARINEIEENKLIYEPLKRRHLGFSKYRKGYNSSYEKTTLLDDMPCKAEYRTWLRMQDLTKLQTHFGDNFADVRKTLPALITEYTTKKEKWFFAADFAEWAKTKGVCEDTALSYATLLQNEK